MLFIPSRKLCFALVSLTGFVLFSIYIVVIVHGSDTRLYSDIVFYSGMLLCWVWGSECVCVGVVGDRVDMCWVVCGGLASGYVILCGLRIPCQGGGSVVEGSRALQVGRWCFVGAYAAQTLPCLCVGNSGPHGGSSTRPPVPLNPFFYVLRGAVGPPLRRRSFE